MRADLAARWLRSMKEEPIRDSARAPVTPVISFPVTCTKPLKLRVLQALHVENDKVSNDISEAIASIGADRSTPGTIVGPLEPDGVEIQQRKAMATDSVPAPCLDAWARLQVQKPMRVSDADWRQAVNDAGRFFDQWGTLAVEFRWTPRDLFDVMRDSKTGGLIWFLNGEDVRALGPEHGVTKSGRIFDRMTRAEWINTCHEELVLK